MPPLRRGARTAATSRGGSASLFGRFGCRSCSLSSSARPVAGAQVVEVVVRDVIGGGSDRVKRLDISLLPGRRTLGVETVTCPDPRANVGNRPLLVCLTRVGSRTYRV